MKTVAAVLSLLFLGSCYHGIEMMKTPDNFEGKVVADSNYQAVFRNLMETGRVCLQQAALGAEVQISGQLYTDVPLAIINQISTGFGVLAHLGEISIKGVNDNKSEISVYREKAIFWSAPAPAMYITDISRWAMGDRRCSTIIVDDSHKHRDISY